MIVVAIIGILAAIAIPNFMRYQLKSKTTEAKENLGGIKTGQETFYGDRDYYADIKAAPTDAPPGTIKQSWVKVDAATDCGKAPPCAASFENINFRPSGDVYYIYECRATAPAAAQPAEYTCSAEADLDGDGDNGCFIFVSDNKGDQTGNTNTDCPGGGTNQGRFSEVVDATPGKF